MRGASALILMLLVGCGAGAALRAVVVPLPPPRPPLPEGEAAPIRQLSPGVLRGLMTAGALRITPDAELAAAWQEAGDRRLQVMVTICLDGANTTRVVTRPSGLPAFDRAALEVVGGWRFRPYRDGATPTTACSVAVFRHGGTPPAGTALPADWEDALPAAEIELPAGRHVAGVMSGGDIQQPATPGVALMRVCRRHGSIEAPQITWLQSSGDPLFDRDLFERRVRVPVGEPAERAPRCDVLAAIARAPGAPAAPQAATSAAIEPTDFAARRVAGNSMILPADDLKNAIQRSTVHEIMMSIHVCVDRDGRPATVTLLTSSGYTGYDMDLLNGVATWRYTPFIVDGKPTPMCSIVKFGYRQR